MKKQLHKHIGLITWKSKNKYNKTGEGMGSGILILIINFINSINYISYPLVFVVYMFSSYTHLSKFNSDKLARMIGLMSLLIYPDNATYYFSMQVMILSKCDTFTSESDNILNTIFYLFKATDSYFSILSEITLWIGNTTYFLMLILCNML